MLTFGELIDAYLTSLKGRPSAPRYEQVYRQYIAPEFGAQRVREVRREQMIAFTQRAISPSQLRKAIAVMSQACAWGRNRINPTTGKLLYDGPNPASGLGLPLAPSRERLATTEELTTILDVLPSLHPRHAAFLAVRLATPCRIKELSEAQPVHVTKLSTGAAWWHKPTTKNGKPQTIYVARQAMSYLNKLDWNQPYFFMGMYGHPWSQDTGRTVWERLMKRLGIQGLQLLDLRRTLVSYLYRLYRRREVDDLTIKALLNHYAAGPSRSIPASTLTTYRRFCRATPIGCGV